MPYTSGEKTREEALTAFKQEVADNLDIIVDLPEDANPTEETEDTEETDTAGDTGAIEENAGDTRTSCNTDEE